MEQETARLRTDLEERHRQALVDALTGVANRGAYEERITQEHAAWKRYRTPLALMVVDVDRFKQINDSYGHKAGDQLLVKLSGIIQRNLRKTDKIGRYGGEEFVMILSGSDKDSALKVANGIRSKIENCGFNSHGKPVKITISCGISQFLENDTHEHAFERALHGAHLARAPEMKLDSRVARAVQQSPLEIVR